jgi:NTE family protein
MQQCRFPDQPPSRNRERGLDGQVSAEAQTKPRRRLNLALQGGGAHGSFTWGVLDRLFQESDLEIVGICGTSAGAMNAAIAAFGIARGGFESARQALRLFWEKTAEVASRGLLQPTPLDRMISPGNMDLSPFWLWYDAASRILSPYQLNPLGWNPLRPVLEEVVDFEFLRTTRAVELFLCATNVKTGRIKVFSHEELSVDAVLASACLPYLFQAVKVDGEYYWDGGFMGNPPIYPLIYGTDCDDVMIIQTNPINTPNVPTTAAEIINRMNELSFNSTLMREMRAINFVSRLVEEGHLQSGGYRRINIHTIDAEEEMSSLGLSSKHNADRSFLRYLFGLGHERAAGFFAEHGDKIGRESSTDIVTKFL